MLSEFNNGFSYYYFSNEKKFIEDLVNSYLKLYPSLYDDLGLNTEKQIDAVLKSVIIEENQEFMKYLRNK